jgi:hypothetical protein
VDHTTCGVIRVGCHEEDNTMQNPLTAASARLAPSDFNGDRISDLVLRDNTGTTTFLYGTSTGAFTVGPTSAWNPAMSIVGTGDLNGDGREDLLFTGGYSDANGTLLITELQTVEAGFQPDWEAATLVPVGWAVVGTGDFDGDGKTDVLLVDGNGKISDWLIGPAGATIVDVPDAPFSRTGAFAANPGSGWNVVGIGDFNGDGRSDVLLRHDNGTITEWLGESNGGFAWNSASTYSLDNSWHLAGAGDFNGDGRSDVLLRHDNGTITEWLGQSNGGFTWNSASTYGLDNSWHLAGAGDFNGDGRSDVLLRHDNGTITEWLGQVDGTFLWNANATYELATSWQVQPNYSGAGAWDY